jgi:hypothetical protein
LSHDVKGHLASIVVQHLFKEDLDGRPGIVEGIMATGLDAIVSA